MTCAHRELYYKYEKQLKRWRDYRNLFGFLIFVGLFLGVLYCQRDSETAYKVRPSLSLSLSLSLSVSLFAGPGRWHQYDYPPPHPPPVHHYCSGHH